MKPALLSTAQGKVYKSLCFDLSDNSKEGLLKNNTAGLSQDRSPVSMIQTLSSGPPRRTGLWTFPEQGLAVFYGPGNVPKLSHYFLPRLLLKGNRVLFLDGANCANPRLLARLARERRVPFVQFNRQVKIARAFTCFQLTELIVRVPRFLESFSADVLVVTALPDLYFDEDVRDWDACVTFEQALSNLSCLARQPLTVAVFSAAMTFAPSAARKNFFARTCQAAGEVWRFSLGEDSQPNLICERGSANARLKPAATHAR